jgi:uncharacterized protein (DUF1330 family)
MSCYFVAQIRIHDHKEYGNYLEKVDEIFSKYKGEYLAVDENPTLLEGSWNYTKSVLIKFKNKQEFQEWYYSVDYQSILRYRLNSSDCDSILIDGLD